ncbi:cytochrome P450 family protein [Streptomyces cacaoi]|uniref:Cytochrome P450 n=1 Tax=Streptomyces cacaoi TaxID=1898 RepID=A0A4Y3QT16_STRCI|nr:cytochrome P450 [Streptomyces cacaoi]NNG86441.1 cytochrome P450 [Streptomyces cacaoi]GEB48475.1 cytochrome P450 [Streptomyces cacaoi]
MTTAGGSGADSLAHASPHPDDAGDPDPYANYAWLRENAPVSEIYAPHRSGRTWLVTSYPLVRAGLADARLSNDDRNSADPPAPFGSGQWDPARGLLDLDRPEHTRLRRLVAGAFSAGAVSAMRPMVERVTDEALEAVAGEGRCDLVESFSLPVPVAVIHEVLGIPEDEREAPARCVELFHKASLTDPPDLGALGELLDYTRRLAVRMRRHPEAVGATLVRGLETGQLRDEDELAAMILSVLGAGHMTTVQFLGAAVHRLLQHPGQLRAVLAGEVAWAGVVNEILRYDSPVQSSVHRYATEDLELAGEHIARGDTVVLSLAAANRDPEFVPEPEEFRVDRPVRSNLAFGHGAHLCLGAHLARLEGEVALPALFARLRDLTLAVPADRVVWTYGPTLRGPRALPVTFRPAH